MQSLFYPQSFKDTFPQSWHQESISFSRIDIEKNKKKLFNSDFVLVNDGWINSINIESFDYFILMNSSCIGPILPSYFSKKNLEIIFTNELKELGRI